MYLKSLVLKGFKSFADRSALSLQPGITAVVGPNGSGKSNISDAVLWVLGERSPSNLRGQAMEDIIFAGSAARKPVSVAEVELVLDNTDKTLPVDYDEVVITRRMYRSGESEYLINGAIVRRMDVLDILHDTGLGTGTHSIISQGNLDSILQSKPEDRRALIEEAAGVLKHKQRKEKSARKLANMDTHLNRVRDIAGEVSRQLAPLERKAKRAEDFKEASAQLKDVKLSLAVDSLRALQVSWDALIVQEKELENEVKQHRQTVDSAEQRVSDYQELMKRESEDASELSRRQRRAANLAERLDGAERVLRERRRSALESEANLEASIVSDQSRYDKAVKELVTAQAQLDTAQVSFREASERAEHFLQEQKDLHDVLLEKQQITDALSEKLTEIDVQKEKARKKRENLQEILANSLAHVKLIEARRVEISTDLKRVQAEDAQAKEVVRQTQERLEELQERVKITSNESTRCFTEREQAQAALDDAREQLRSVEAQIHILEASIRSFNEEDPALVWVMDNAQSFTGGATPLATALKVEPSLEYLVEGLLGSDLSALAVQNATTALSIAESIAQGKLSGDVSLFLLQKQSDKKQAVQKSAYGHPLLDEVTYSTQIAPAVEALLGDIVICADRTQAVEAYEREALGLRYVSPDGFAIEPAGKVRIFGSRVSDNDGVLARERKLDEARAALSIHERTLEQATVASQEADEAYRAAQSASLKANEELANHRGTLSAAVAEQERVSAKLATLAHEMEEIDSQMQGAQQTVDELRPQMQDLDSVMVQFTESHTRITEHKNQLLSDIGPLQTQNATLSDVIAEAKLTAAKFDERQSYAARIVDGHKGDIERILKAIDANKEAIVRKSVMATRGLALLEIFEQLALGLGRRTRSLDEALNASESSTNTVHSDAANAREAARQAHNEYDAVSARMADLQVRKSRLEMQVQAAVDVVVVELETPLDVAQELPAVEDRSSLEDERYRLERSIKNMGVINPDAANEYAELKERYDFLAGQLSDMEEARCSLDRIVQVIDSRMKDDFIRTFEQVNTNFNEIFSLLFPGGNANLSLVDPDDIENSGVEVSAQPAGKRLTKMMLMSGGEKSLTALALLFAIYRIRSTPFYILDEVEAALDDSNLRRLTAYIDSLRSTTQLIMITHQRRTMEMADVLFGVSMQSDGVTKIISQRLDRALEQSKQE